MEKALAAIHQALTPGETVTFSYRSTSGRVGLFVHCDDDCSSRVSGPLIANYPQCHLTPTIAEEGRGTGRDSWIVTGRLVPEIFPLLRHPQFEDQLNRVFADPIDSVLRSVRPEAGMDVEIEWIVTPVAHARRHTAVHAVELLDREFFRRHPRLARYFAQSFTRRQGRFAAAVLGRWAERFPVPVHTTIESSTSRLHEREEDLQAAAAKVGGHLFDAQVRITVHADTASEELARDRLSQVTGAMGAFTATRLATFSWGPPVRNSASPRVASAFLLSHDEVATLFHPPTASVIAEGLQASAFAELEPPVSLPSDGSLGTLLLGNVRFRGDTRPVRITLDAKRRHLYIVGATGTGKSTLLSNLMSQQMNAGEGFTVIDVHGDLADGLLRIVPTDRTNDVIVFDPAGQNPVPFNPLACLDPARADQIVSGTVSAFRKLFESWGPRLENLLRFAVFAVVEKQGTLLDVLQLLTDATVRDRMVPRIEDEIVRSFWEHEFKSWNTQYRTEAVSSVTNKVLPFLTNSRLRATVTSSSRGLDVRQVMDRGQILVINLSRGRLGQDNATLLGSMLLTAIEQAALSRAELPEHERLDHSLYLDEFQTLVTPSTAIMLSEARKYRLNLTLSHQLTRQLDEPTRQAVLGNCGSFVSFRVGTEDAELLSPAFSRFPGQLSAASLMGLPNYVCYVRMLLQDGMPSGPFSLQTNPLPETKDDRTEIVRRTSQRRFPHL